MDETGLHHRDDFLKAKTKLVQQSQSWWAPLAREGVLLKLIVGAFLLYMGYVVVQLMGVALLVLLYTIAVVGIVWYVLDLMRQQYAQQRQTHAQQIQQLEQRAQHFLWQQYLKEQNPQALPIKKRQLQAARSLLPYVWGISPEQWQQRDYFEWQGIQVAQLSIEQEGQPPIHYWLLGTVVDLPHGEESTAILPQPYAHDRWERVQYNAAIETPEFQAQYRLFTSAFWHSYAIARAATLQQFLTIAGPQKGFLVIRKGWLYLALPQAAPTVLTALDDWAAYTQQIQQQGAVGLALAQQVEGLVQTLRPNLTSNQ